MDREANRKTTTIDMVMLFGMPAVIAVLTAAIIYFAMDLNAAIGQ